jgi:putative hydrolase of the HAD superfamily
MKIKALIFDIDGTVYSNTLMYLYTLPLMLRHPRTMITFAKARRLLHYCSEDIDASGLGFKAYQARMLGEMRGISSEEAQRNLDSFRTSWEKIFDTVRPYKGFKESIIFFKEAGLKTGLLSDFPLGKKMERLGLSGLWDAELCTEDAGALKPDPRSFLQVASLLGTAPEEVLFVGNSHKFDVIGAKKAGMLAAHLRWRGPVKNSLADFTFYHYKDLRKRVAGLLQ